ncbi:MAG: drug:proton antiporter [Rhodobacterales bacterium 12-64-8]|nr:MAG: drug:proton antiporter [Rhodobacterales bacterium 12-64-8]OYX46413.1 MAG: drug:proton antiporter [Alphaproteobacteria bacterium 32-64-14]
MDTPPLNDQSRPDRRGSFLLLFFCLLAVGAGNTMLTSAVLPPLTRELKLPDWTAGAIFSLSAAVWVVTAPYWGAKSNVWGRRKVAAIGMFGFAASMFFFALVSLAALLGWITNWILIFVLLLTARTLFGVFGSATNPAAQAYVADRTSRSERMDEIATLTSGFTLGQMAGPAAAAALITGGAILSPTVGLLAPVIVITVIAAVIAWLVLTRLPENRTPRADAGHGRSSGAKGLWKHPAIFPFLLYAVALSLVTGVLSQTFPYAIMDRMNAPGAASAQFTGPAMTLGAMATLISQLVLIPRLKLPVRSLMVYGAIMLAFASLFMVWAQDFALFAFAQILFGFGQGFARPGFSAGASLAATHEQQGDVAGLITAANGMGFVISPLFGLWMYENVSSEAPFIVCTVVVVLMALYAFFTTPKDSGDKNTAVTDAVAKDKPPE